jgi:hypothetical protein
MLEKFAAQSLIEDNCELIFSKEKFAELIVRECIDAIDAARPYHTNDHLVNDYMNGVEHGHKFAITMIRKHFGVEE